MPKPKPTQVIRHEIVLGRAEREMIDGPLMAFAFGKVAQPVVDLLNDVTGTITFFTLLAAAGLTGVTFAFLVSEELSVAGVVDSFLDQREQAKLAKGIEITTSDWFGLESFLKEYFGVEGLGNKNRPDEEKTYVYPPGLHPSETN